MHNAHKNEYTIQHPHKLDHSNTEILQSTNLEHERENLKRAGQLEQRQQKRPEKLPPPVVTNIVGYNVRIVIVATAAALFFVTHRMFPIVAETNHRNISIRWLPFRSTLVENRTHMLQRRGVDVLRILGARKCDDILDDIRRLRWWWLHDIGAILVQYVQIVLLLVDSGCVQCGRKIEIRFDATLTMATTVGGCELRNTGAIIHVD